MLTGGPLYLKLVNSSICMGDCSFSACYERYLFYFMEKAYLRWIAAMFQHYCFLFVLLGIIIKAVLIYGCC